MKKYFYIIFILPVILASCETIPDARFTVDTVVAYVGEEVYFTNQSYNAVNFEWDFGDGTWTNVTNPVHTFNSTGNFEVVLTAESKSGNISRAYKTITILAPTMLEVEVMEWRDDDLVVLIQNANVRLYGSLYDWDNEENIIIEGNTDQYGKVLFTGLQQAVYYIDVWEPNFNNWDLRGYENDYWITTDQLLPNQVNRFIAYVDYVGTKGPAERDRSYIIKKIDRKPKEK